MFSSSVTSILNDVQLAFLLLALILAAASISFYVFTKCFAFNRHMPNPLAFVNLVWQDRSWDHCFGRLKDGRKHDVDKRSNCEAEDPCKGVWADSNAGVDGWIDAVDEAGKVGRYTNNEGCNSTPIDAIGVAVDATSTVNSRLRRYAPE